MVGGGDSLLQQRASRFVDGEVSDPQERERCEKDLVEDPRFRAVVEDLQSLRRVFAASGDGPTAASTGFAARVLADVRRLPERSELEAAESGDLQIVRWAQWVIAAAVLIAATATALWAGAVHTQQGPAELHAAPDEIRAEMERLDAEIERARRETPRERR